MMVAQPLFRVHTIHQDILVVEPWSRVRGTIILWEVNPRTCQRVQDTTTARRRLLRDTAVVPFSLRTTVLQEATAVAIDLLRMAVHLHSILQRVRLILLLFKTPPRRREVRNSRILCTVRCHRQRLAAQAAPTRHALEISCHPPPLTRRKVVTTRQ